MNCIFIANEALCARCGMPSLRAEVAATKALQAMVG